MCVCVVCEQVLPFERSRYPSTAILSMNSCLNCVVVMYQHSYGYFNVLSHCLHWKIARLIWIGFYKNCDNIDCLISKLPKDIIHHIFQFLTIFSVGNNNIQSEIENTEAKCIKLISDYSNDNDNHQTYKPFKFDQKRLNHIFAFATLALVCAVTLRLIS